MKIKIQLTVPEPFYQKALAALDFIAQTGRKCISISTDNECDIYYGEARPIISGAKFLFFNPKYYSPTEPFELINNQWLPKGENGNRFDLIGAIYRLLYLLDETQRQRATFAKGFSSFFTTDLPKQRQKFTEVPICDHYVDEFFGKKKPPNEKRNLTICLTHDVDGPEIASRVEILKSAAKAILRRKKKYVWQVAKGMQCAITRQKGPFWHFEKWLEKEKNFGAKSAFFFFPGKEVYKKHFNDPPYQISYCQKWRLLHEIIEKGGEVGVHPGIYYKESGIAFHHARQKFNRMGIDVRGVRHHYWELNWDNPFETFMFQAKSGFRYDLSIAWKDKPGFRMGTCRPFKSWMPNQPDLSHVVIPTAIMDGHLFEYANLDRGSQIEKVKQIASIVAKEEGVLVLDWHERVFEETPMYPGYGSLYFQVLELLCDQFSVEFLLPGEIYQKTISNHQKYRLLRQGEFA